MKVKYFFATVCLSAFLYAGQAQETTFGIKGGVNFTFFKVDEQVFGSTATSETGFYAGLFTSVGVNERVAFQPEILYVGLNDFKFLNIPLYVKYEMAQYFYMMVGPGMNYFFDFLQNKFKVGVDLASQYKILPGFDIHVKYLLGLQQITPNGIFIGVGIEI